MCINDKYVTIQNQANSRVDLQDPLRHNVEYITSCSDSSKIHDIVPCCTVIVKRMEYIKFIQLKLVTGK